MSLKYLEFIVTKIFIAQIYNLKFYLQHPISRTLIFLERFFFFYYKHFFLVVYTFCQKTYNKKGRLEIKMNILVLLFLINNFIVQLNTRKLC